MKKSNRENDHVLLFSFWLLAHGAHPEDVQLHRGRREPLLPLPRGLEPGSVSVPRPAPLLLRPRPRRMRFSRFRDGVLHGRDAARLQLPGLSQRARIGDDE